MKFHNKKIFDHENLRTITGIPQEDEFVNLVLRMGEFTRSCTVSASDSRRFIGGYGVAYGAEKGDCTEALWNLAQDFGFTTTTTTTTQGTRF